MEIFNLQFLSKRDQEIVFCESFQRKEAFLDHKNINSKNPQNLHCFGRGKSMVFVKKWRFFNFQFLCKMDQEKGFFEGCKGKKAFLDDKKNRLQKTTKICIFLKGVSPWFLSKKWRFFNLQFICKMDQEIVFFEGSERNEAFLDQKNIDLKNHQNLHFFETGQSMVFVKK